MKQYIVCAAHKKENRIITGARHYDSIICQQIELTEGYDWWAGAEQGFIDQNGNFLTREDALKIAMENNQIRRRCGGDDGQLFSENLY